MDLRVAAPLHRVDEGVHATLADRACPLLHRPEGELAKTTEQAAANRAGDAERLGGDVVGIECGLGIEWLAFLVGSTRGIAVGRKADGVGKTLVRGVDRG